MTRADDSFSLQHDSLAEIPEPALVRALLRDPHRRTRLLSIRGLPKGAAWAEQVPLTGLPGNPKGDIDILLWTPHTPDQATAIQVKRFKAYVAGQEGNQLNRLGEFRKGVEQANRLLAIGFYQVYLWVFVLVDSRVQNAGQITFDGLTPELRTQVENTISTQHLANQVGLIHHEIVQPMDHAALEMGSFGGHLIRLPMQNVQPQLVTEWVAKLPTTNRVDSVES
jgi:hypothetical protein